MLLSEKLGEAVLLLSLVALCTAGRSRILNSLVENADDTLHDRSPGRDDIDDLQLQDFTESSTTREEPVESPDERTTYVYSHYHVPSPTHYPYAYGSFASSPFLYTPNPYNYGLYAMTTPYPYHRMAGYHPYSAMNSLYAHHPMATSYFSPAMTSPYGYHPMATSYFSPAMTSPYGYHPMATSYFSPAMTSPYGYSPMASYYPYSAMNPLYGYHPMATSYFNAAMTSPYGYSPMASYYPYSAMNPLYGYYPMAAFGPAMNSFYPMVAPYQFPAVNPLNVPVNGTSPKPSMTAYTFHAPMAPFSYLQPPMGYSPLYPPVGGSYYPMNSFYPYSAALMPFNSFHPPMYPLSYLQPPMGYPFVYPAMNTMHPYNLMNPMYNPAHPMHPMNPLSPLNPMTNPAHPMNPMNPVSPLNPMTNPAHPMNPYNPMNPINSLYHPMNFAYPFHPPMQVASYFLTPPMGAASPLNLHMYSPYSYQAGMYSPYFLPPYHPSAALQAMYPPYGYAAGVPGAMGWNPFGGAVWNPYSAMGYGAYPQWPSQFAHMWPLHPYYQTMVPAQEGICSYDRPFKCWGSSTCITIAAICDKTFDCNNHADEDPRICIAGRRPGYDILVSYLALPNQQWMLQKLFNNVDPYTTAYALKLATSLGDLRWSLALTDENINNTKTVLEAVKNDNKESVEALGMQASAWESVKFLMNSLLSTDFFLN